MHTLVVGGTGMLVGVTRRLAEQGHIVSFVSRRGNQGLFSDLTAGKMNSIAVDYHDSSMLRRRICEAISAHGPIQLAVFWIHSDAPDGFQVIANEISNHVEVSWTLFHVRGSVAHLHSEPPQVPCICLYRQVILGFVADGNGSRWLMNDEISGGVIEAIRCDRERSVVGTLEPWEKRPV